MFDPVRRAAIKLNVTVILNFRFLIAQSSSLSWRAAR